MSLLLKLGYFFLQFIIQLKKCFLYIQIKIPDFEFNIHVKRAHTFLRSDNSSGSYPPSKKGGNKKTPCIHIHTEDQNRGNLVETEIYRRDRYWLVNGTGL